MVLRNFRTTAIKPRIGANGLDTQKRKKARDIVVSDLLQPISCEMFFFVFPFFLASLSLFVLIRWLSDFFFLVLTM